MHGELIAGMSMVRNGAVSMSYVIESCTQNGDELSKSPEENPAALDERLLRYRSVLSFVAYRVLSDHEEAEEAVRNCLLSASYNVPRFECEGAFRGWLVRILMDKAVLILHKKRLDRTHRQ
jgi:RNA polymerase sigma-70 factor, ECF subfamily